VTAALEAIPGARDRAQLGRDEAAAGLGIPLEELVVAPESSPRSSVRRSGRDEH